MRHRSARAIVIAVAILICLVAWFSVGLWLADDYRNTVREKQDALDRMSQIAAEHLRRLVSLTDLFLDTLEQSASRSGGGPDAEVAARFAAILGDEECIVPVAVIGRDGLLRGLFNNQEIDVHDRPYLGEARSGRLVVSSPIQSRVDGRSVIPLLRGIEDPSSPVAVMITAIDIDALERLYDTFRVKNGGAITLIRSDGLVLARSPQVPGAVGAYLTSNPAFQRHAGKGDRGVFTETSPLDGQQRTAAFSMVKPYGLGVLVSMSTQEIMAPWWQRARVGLVILLAVTATVLGGLMLVLRLLGRLEREAQGLEARVEERTRDLRRMMDRRRVFLASLSHELRSPLNVILGFSDAMLGGLHGALTPGQRGYLADIHRSGCLLLDLVNDLLDSAAIEAGSLRLDVAPLDLGDLLHEVEAMISRQAGAAAITVSVRIDPAGLKLRADRRRLLQVLLNLATNAVKYGGPGCQVDIVAGLTADRGCRISVTDTGRGMSEEAAALALTPFGRANNVAAIEGTGLGLPLSAGICALHDGTLTVTSRLGEGTQVVIVLPSSRVILPEEEPSRPPLCPASVSEG